MNERVTYATFANDGPAVAESDLVDVLLDIWLTSIYRTTAPYRTDPAVGASRDAPFG